MLGGRHSAGKWVKKRERKGEAKFEKAICFEARSSLPFHLSLSFSSSPPQCHILRLLWPQCAACTGFCPSPIVMFLQHQPIACIWGLYLDGGRSPWLLNKKWGVFQERLQLRPEGFPADNPSHPHCQDLLTLEQEKGHLSCLVSQAKFTVKHCKREKTANISHREDWGIQYITRTKQCNSNVMKTLKQLQHSLQRITSQLSHKIRHRSSL